MKQVLTRRAAKKLFASRATAGRPNIFVVCTRIVRHIENFHHTLLGIIIDALRHEGRGSCSCFGDARQWNKKEEWSSSAHS